MQNTQRKKLNVSLPPELIVYIDSYGKNRGLKNRRDVIVKALQALREKELINSYQQAIRDHLERPDFWFVPDVKDDLESNFNDAD